MQCANCRKREDLVLVISRPSFWTTDTYWSEKPKIVCEKCSKLDFDNGDIPFTKLCQRIESALNAGS